MLSGTVRDRLRVGLLAWGLGLAALAAGLAGGLAAQPREEEEEQPGAPPAAADVEPGVVDLAREAAAAAHPSVRDLFRRLATPADVMVGRGGETRRVLPLPRPWSEVERGEISATPLLAGDRPGKVFTVKADVLRTIRPYEEVAAEEVKKFLARDLMKEKVFGGEPLPRAEQLLAAQKVLTAALRFHQSAVEQNRRVGPGWEPVKAPLEELLKQVRRERLKIFVGRGQWAQAGRIAMRLGVDYPNDRGVLRDIYHLQLAEAAATLRPDAADSFEDFRRLRDALDQYVERVAEEGKGDELVGAARRRLREEAERYAAEARKLAAAGDAAAAREQLLRAQRLDPALEGVSELRSALDAKYPILYVGMRGLPERVSPPLARTDADRRAVELVFEGLVEAVPDRTLGRRYRPVLAEAAPGLVPLGRSFRLRPGVKWAPPGGSPGEPPRPFDANDVRGTLEMLRAKPDTWAARDAVLLEEVRGIANPLRLDLILRRGYLDPLAPMTFKVLPARRLRQSQSGAFDTGFARQPVGTGPYRFDGVEREQSGRLCAVFRANPYYGQRPGQLGRPFIREIRLFDVTGSSDPVADLARGNMHIWLDLTSADLARLRADAAAAAQARIYTNRSHRRVHFLAVNHRMPALQSPELRRGLAAAIDREKILDEVFRAGEAGAHRALAGPFPPGSWPAPEKAQPLHNAVLAGSLLGEKAPKELRLAYPADDPAAQEACQRIKEQIEQAAGGKTEVILEKFPPEELYRKVELEHVFDLAYYHFDYADDLFWLGGLFDRGATGTGGRNYMGYLGQGAGAEDLRLEQLVNAPHEHRDFALLRRQAAALHAQFVTQMPFIPLWHLDRHAAVRRDVEIVIEGADADPSLLDPATFFTGVEAWKLR